MRLRWLIFAPILVVLSYLFIGTVGGWIKSASNDQGDDWSVYLLKGPIHTDFLIPLNPQTRRNFAVFEAGGMPIQDSFYNWIIIGWGAKEFYTTTGNYSDLSARAVAKAIFGDGSVLRVDLARGAVPEGVAKIDLSDTQFLQFQIAILNSLELPTEPILVPDAGFTQTDRFFVSRFRFNILKTCNVWAGKILRDAGVRVGIWTPFTWSL